MNSNPLISIVIPAYNTRDVVEKTLNSVEEQTYQHYEMIIIDDGSMDGTGQFLDEYKKYNDKCIVYHQKNSGVSVARNKGIELSTGEFICFLDSDDTYASTFLEKMISRQQITNADVVYCGFYRVRKNSVTKEEFVFDEGNIVSSFIKKCFHMSGMLLRKKFLIEKNITFDKELKVCEDIYFTVKAITCAQTFAVKEHLFNYLYRGNSVTNAENSIKLYENDIEAWERIHDFLNNNYNKQDSLDVLQLVVSIIIKLKIRLLTEYLKSFDYNNIRSYLKKNTNFYNDVQNVIPQYLSKSDRKKLNIIKSNNLFIWFKGSIYYRYIRCRSDK